jgi:DNA phosphorothioation-associated putative methyltransferase
MKASVARYRTALTRVSLSRPVNLALEDGLIDKESAVFDYGCGHGDDVRILTSQGIACGGWDPAFSASAERREADVVNLGYVINVIEHSDERASVLRDAWSLARKTLVVSARLALEKGAKRSSPYADGCLTERQTFQKYYEQQELRDWIEAILGVSSIAAAPGIFYVFRDPAAAQRYLASRYRTRQVVPRARHTERLFDQYRDLLHRLMVFVAERGRLPEETELDTAAELRLALGSIRRAWAIVQRVTGSREWEEIARARAEGLLIYLALARFGGRCKFAELPTDLQLDVRAFFRTYSRACQKADALLFSAGNLAATDEACRTSQVGKLTSSALYIHVSALAKLPPILRIYEGCARSYVGVVEGANVVKLHRPRAQVSYLQYPRFENDAHPILAASLIVPLHTLRVEYRDYTDRLNPPILHRKEELICADHPLRQRFARLTRQEERRGLYDQSEVIGTLDGWRQALERRGLYLAGHRLLRRLS